MKALTIDPARPVRLGPPEPAAPRLEGWHPSGLPIRVLYVSLGGLFALLMIAGLLGYWTHPHSANDFYAFNSYSRFIRHHAPSAIYDQGLLRDFQALPSGKVFAFMYPPTMLALLWPVASLPYALGYVLCVGLGLTACAVAVGARPGAWPLGLVVIVAPSTLWTILCGQSTLLLAALVVSGMLVSNHRPIVAGVLIGLATYKPQLGILVPVALIASAQWRTMFSAGLTVLSLVLLTTIAFGHDVWLAWLLHLSAIVDVRTQHASSWASLFSTVASDLVTLGFGRRLADFGQALSCLVVVVWVWRVFRRPGVIEAGKINQLRVALLCVATFLATPFAFIYDLPLFTAGLLLFLGERRQTGDAFHSSEILIIVGGLLDPCIFLIDGAHSLGSVAILLVLVAISRRIHTLRSPLPACGSPIYMAEREPLTV